MKQKILQWGVISASASLTILVGLFIFQSAKHLGKTDLISVQENVSTGSVSYEKRIKKGDELFAYGYYEEAITEYAYAAKLEPEQDEVFVKLSTAYTALAEFEKAKFHAQSAYELDPNLENRALYGKALLRISDLEAAKKILSEVTEENPSIAYAKALLALIEEDHETASKEFQKALELSNDENSKELQNFVNAYSTYASAQGSDGAYRGALLCKALIDAKEYILAETLALKTLNEKNDYRDVWMLLGYAQLELGNWASAEDSFRAAKKIDSTKPEVHYFLGSTLFLQENYEEAIKEMELALIYDFKPEVEAYKIIAQSQSILGRHEEALAVYEVILNMNPQSIEEFLSPIEAAIHQVKDLDRALTLAEKAITNFPNEALSHTLLAQVYLAKGVPDLAESSIQTAFDINPNSAEAHLVAGQIREAEANIEGAKWEYKKAFELSKPGDKINQSAAQFYNLLTLPTNVTP